MRAFAFFATALAVIMAAAILYGVSQGDFRAEGGQLLGMPWGIVTLVDLYTGFLLFSGWVVLRERSWVRAPLWILAILAGGNLVCCVYVLLALASSRGDWPRFWMGQPVVRTR